MVFTRLTLTSGRDKKQFDSEQNEVMSLKKAGLKEKAYIELMKGNSVFTQPLINIDHI